MCSNDSGHQSNNARSSLETPTEKSKQDAFSTQPTLSSSLESNKGYKVFVGGLSPSTTSEHLREYFTNFGTVDEVLVMRERGTGRSRCFAFMTFLDRSILEKVLEVPQHWLQGHNIEVKRAIPRGEVNPRSQKLFIGGIPPSVTSETLRKSFEKYGKILDAQVIRDRVRGNPRGFGFIRFEDMASMELVLAESRHELDGKVVDVKKAEPKCSSNVPASNSPYPVVPTMVYFMPYHVVPGSVNGAYMGFPTMYPAMNYLLDVDLSSQQQENVNPRDKSMSSVKDALGCMTISPPPEIGADSTNGKMNLRQISHCAGATIPTGCGVGQLTGVFVMPPVNSTSHAITSIPYNFASNTQKMPYFCENSIIEGNTTAMRACRMRIENTVNSRT